MKLCKYILCQVEGGVKQISLSCLRDMVHVSKWILTLIHSILRLKTEMSLSDILQLVTNSDKETLFNLIIKKDSHTSQTWFEKDGLFEFLNLSNTIEVTLCLHSLMHQHEIKHLEAWFKRPLPNASSNFSWVDYQTRC